MEQQVVLLYDGSFEGFLSGVFTTYEEKLTVSNIFPAGKEVQELFSTVREIYTDQHKAERVWGLLKKKVSRAGLRDIKYAFLSESEGVELELLTMIRYITSENKMVDRDFSHPAILRVAQEAKKVGREKHRMEAFVRFRLTRDDLFFSTIEPDFNVLPIIKEHVRDRYADQKWVIYDLKRKFGVFYDLKKVSYITLDLDPKIGISGASDEFFDSSEQIFQKLWGQYFKSTNISSRANRKLHLQHLPKRYWKYLTEKNIED